MRSFDPRFRKLVLCVVVLPGFLRADATISSTTRITSLALAPQTMTSVVRLKDNKGMTVEGTRTTVIDFARQQVTIFDSASRLYTTLSMADYRTAIESMQKSTMPAVGQMMKSMKVSCDPTPPAAAPAPAEEIAGVHAVEHDVSCTMTMNMPANVAQMPTMTMTMSMKTWLPMGAELNRVPALSQLSSFEQARSLLFDRGMSGMLEAFKPLRDELGKNQALALRSVMEMSMNMGPAGATPLTKTETEVDKISTDPIDDAEFALPAGYTRATYAEIENSATQARVQALRTPTPSLAQRQKPAQTGDVRAYVPSLLPLTQTEPETPAGAGNMTGQVRLLATITPKGTVAAAEALGGPEALRRSAIEAVKQWTYRPVLRDGAPVTAYTDANVFFFGGDGTPFPGQARMDDGVSNRMAELLQAFPRSEEQTFADAEQDASGRESDERFDMLPDLAVQALHVKADDKARAFANELIAALPEHTSDPGYGEALYDAHMALGLVALHDNDVATAERELLASARTSGSPVMDSFGPNMWLAYELLKKGESGVVVDFLNQARTFWKDGSPQIDEWIETIRKGSLPVFGANWR